MTIQNGTVSDSKVVGTPASSSINDSQPDSETEQDSRSQEQEATNEKKKKPNKNRKKIGRQDDDDEDSKLCNFPMDRIKRIFKTQSSDFGVTREAVFLVNKATVPVFFFSLLCLLGFLFETLYFGIVKIL